MERPLFPMSELAALVGVDITPRMCLAMEEALETVVEALRQAGSADPEGHARSALEAVQNVHGGTTIYIGKGQEGIRAKRDLEIYLMATGRNRRFIARSIGITDSRVKQIVRGMRKRASEQRNNAKG